MVITTAYTSACMTQNYGSHACSVRDGECKNTNYMPFLHQVDLVLTIEESFLYRMLLSRCIKRKVEFVPFKKEHLLSRVLKAVKYFFWGDDLAGSIREYHKRHEVICFVCVKKKPILLLKMFH